MTVVDQINHEDNTFRSVYRECVRDETPEKAAKWQPFSREETCVLLIMAGSAKTGVIR
jgi:hypothetical protein